MWLNSSVPAEPEDWKNTATSGSLIWDDLDRQLQNEEPTLDGVWTGLKDTANLSNYRPAQAQEVVSRQLEFRRGRAHTTCSTTRRPGPT